MPESPMLSAAQAFHQSLSDRTDPTKPNCLLGCSGSVATVKVPEIAVALRKRGFNVFVVSSERGKFFLDRSKDYNSAAWQEFMDLGGYDMLFQDSDEWRLWEKMGNSVLHIELRKWANIFVVAPASADLLGKASAGICDNLLLSVMRAWDFQKPCVLCPAMNSVMWTHPATAPTLRTLQGWGWQIVDPVSKLLACGDVGNGAMAAVTDIVEAVVNPKPPHVPASAGAYSSGFSPPLPVASPPTEQRVEVRFLQSLKSGLGIGLGIAVMLTVAELLIGVILPSPSGDDYTVVVNAAQSRPRLSSCRI